MSSRTAIFLGSKKFGLAVFKALRASDPDVNWRIIHPDDRADSRSVLSDFEKEAKKECIDIEIVFNAKETSRVLSKQSYDIGFVCGYYWLLPDSEVAEVSPPLYGIHNSALPNFRGGSPLTWAIIRGDKDIRSTLFKLTPGMDNGPLAGQITHRLEDTDTIADVLSSFEQQWCERLRDLWPLLVLGTADLEEQDEEQAEYCAQRRPEDGEINFFETAEYIHNFVRAQAHPYPGAFTYIRRKKCVIERTFPFCRPFYCRPGQILKRDLDKVLVGCGKNTALWVYEVRTYTNVNDAFPKDVGRLVDASTNINQVSK